jgi:DNA-binding SARP family transcriptional activator
MEKSIIYTCRSGDSVKAKKLFLKLSADLLKINSYKKIRSLLKEFTREDIESDNHMLFLQAASSHIREPITGRQILFNLAELYKKTRENGLVISAYCELLKNHILYMESRKALNRLTAQALAFLNLLTEFEAETVKDNILILEAYIDVSRYWSFEERNSSFEKALKAEETSFKTRDYGLLSCARIMLSHIYLEKGQFEEAKNILSRTDTFLKEKADEAYRVFINFHLADVHLYSGDIRKALELVKYYLRDESLSPAFKSHIRINYVFFQLFSDELDLAENIFESMREENPTDNLYMQYQWVYYLQLLYSYRNGNRIRTEYHSRRLLDSENEGFVNSDYPYSFISISEVLIFLENYSEAEKILRSIAEKTGPESFPFAKASASALLAYLTHITGRTEEAAGHMKQAEEILTAFSISNLYICDPVLLAKIQELSKSEIFSNFPRLASAKISEAVISMDSFDLRFKTFGSFKVFVKNKDIPFEELSRQKKAVDLLKLLVVFREKGLSKETAYEIFWPRYSFKSARDNLNTVVYRLRKIFGQEKEYIIADNNNLMLKPGEYITDADIFLDYIKQGLASEKKGGIKTALYLYRMAESLYEGDFLEAGLYFDSIRDEREQLKNKYRKLLFDMCRLSLDVFEYAEALKWAQKLIETDPFCEPAYRLLMIASIFVGNRNEIPRIFSKLEQKLMEFYNVNADPKTADLKNKLLSGEKPQPQQWASEVII